MEIVMPYEWRINIKRTSNDLYELEYVELIKLPDNLDIDVEQFARNIDTLLSIINLDEKKIYVDENNRIIEVHVKYRDKIERIASRIVGEFIIPSSIGSITLRDIILFNTSIIIKDHMQVVEPVEQNIGTSD